MFPDEYSPLTLAFLGDGVYDLLARKYLLEKANMPIGELHKLKISIVNASSQAKASEIIQPYLTEEEAAIFRRGRNAHTGNTPKNSSLAEYHFATGLEALFGWLWLSEKNERINELFDIIIDDKNKQQDE